MIVRSLRLAAAFVAVLLSPQIWPAWAAPTPTFSISSPTANAGQPEIFTISRVSGGGGAYVLFQTSDGTAKAGTDYMAVHQLVYIKAGAQSVTVAVPTLANPVATGTLTFKAAIASTTSGGIASTATIVEPAPTIVWPHCAWEGGTCSVVGTANVRYGFGATWTAARSVTGSIDCSNATWGDPLVGTGKECVTDGTVAAPAPAPTPVPAPTPAPAPTSAAIYWTSCWDGSLIHADRPCPALPASWVAAPLQDGAGYARIATAAHQSPLFGRPLVAGEIVRVVGPSADLRLVQAISDLDVMELPASDLQGVAPGP